MLNLRLSAETKMQKLILVAKTLQVSLSYYSCQKLNFQMDTKMQEKHFI